MMDSERALFTESEDADPMGFWVEVGYRAMIAIIAIRCYEAVGIDEYISSNSMQCNALPV